MAGLPGLSPKNAIGSPKGAVKKSFDQVIYQNGKRGKIRKPVISTAFFDHGNCGAVDPVDSRSSCAGFGVIRCDI